MSNFLSTPILMVNISERYSLIFHYHLMGIIHDILKDVATLGT